MEAEQITDPLFSTRQENSVSEIWYGDIIIPLALPRTYTWTIPAKWQSQLTEGCRVEVSLKNKKYAGVLARKHQQKPEGFEPKAILNVLDSQPVVYKEQLLLWKWIADYYLCSEGEVMAAALPAHLKLSSETTLVYNEEYGDDFSALDNDEFIVAEALLIKRELKLSEVQQLLDSNHVYPVVKRLIDKKCCFVWEALKTTYKPKKETYISLDTRYAQEEALAALLNEDVKLHRAEKQMELLLAFLHLQRTEGEVSKSSLLRKSNATDAQLKGLIQKNILVAEKRIIGRIQYLARELNIDFILSEAQEKSLAEIKAVFLEKQVGLLHGVTSSGKTQVYIKLIEAYMRSGKQILYLLPEIALTSQIIRRLQKHFGGYIGIYHSKFSQNERLEIWNKIREGELKLVLGARSALFLPFESLGLIIVDEEHDASYKQQEPAPRYHARDAAVYYASLFKAKVLLGSATPSLETYYNAVQGKYGKSTLTERFGNWQLPEIGIIDTKKINKKEKARIIISETLQEAITASLAKNKQVLLFQNRRGYSPYQICQVCGWIPQCRQCDVSLTFHKLSNKLQCHYCGELYPPVQTCAACGSHQFIQRNFGTERIEEQLEELFPSAKIARMDIDSVRGKTAHDNLIQLFEQRRVDMLVGTQMIVKGLDFEHVNLVGILDADSLLSFADFRVNERAFQLMEQVSGRAGRRDGEGRVMIQVANTNHPVLAFVKKHDYPAFFDFEMGSRKQFSYPPFTRIILVHFKHKSKDLVQTASMVFARNLDAALGKWMVGPAEPVVARIRNQYLMELLFKIPKDAGSMQLAKRMIRQQIIILQTDKKFQSVRIIVDVDAV